MRKQIILPIAAAALGLAGCAVRTWELATAFESTGLVTPNAPASWCLILLSLAALAFFLLMSRGVGKGLTTYDAAFRMPGCTLSLAAQIISAGLLCVVTVLLILSLPGSYQTAVQDAVTAGHKPISAVFSITPRVLLTLFCPVTALCVFSSALHSFRDGSHGKYSFRLLTPAYTCCMWLVVVYQGRAGDPVVLDYMYQILAIMAAVLALYFIAGFSFEQGKPFRTLVFSMGGVYLCLLSLANREPLYVKLLSLSMAILLLVRLAALLRRAEENSQITEESTHE